MKIFRITFFLFFISKIALAQFLVFPDYDATLIKPIVKGLSHPQVCVAPDGLYYLTGTTGDPKDDFENDGIHMWKSKDLQHWEEMGKVFDVSEITWQNRGEPVYGTYHSKRKNGCRGAELHFIKGAYYLVYSTVYQSIGILKSKTGKPEGPYEDLGKLLPWGYDPSLFEDSDGTVFLTWNGGFIARLTNDLKKINEKPKLIFPEIFPNKGWGQYPVLDKVGTSGAHIIKINGKYCLVANDFQQRLGTWCDDLFLAVSDGDIYGPYHRREFIVPHASHSTIFKDRNNNWWTTFSGNSKDSYAPFSKETGFLPLILDAKLFLKPSPKYILAKGHIASMHAVKSVKDIFMRDPSICVGHDKSYYLVSTPGVLSLPPTGGLKIWRSKDLSQWDDLGSIWNWDKNATWQTNRNKDIPKGKDFLWAPEISYINETYWICFSYSQSPRVTSLIKSVSGKPEGPYVDALDKPISEGIDGFLFQDDDGQVYYIWGGGQMVKMKKDMSGFANSPKTILAAGNEKMGYEGCSLIKYKGKYILTASDHTGDHNGTYDLMYAISDKIEGPYSERRFAAGHAGHATLFHGTNGKLYATIFGSDSHSPIHQQLGIIEIDFDKNFNFEIKDTKIGY